MLFVKVIGLVLALGAMFRVLVKWTAGRGAGLNTIKNNTV